MASAANQKFKERSQEIINDPKNLQKLPQLIKLFKQNASTSANGILWLERIFIHYNEKIAFLASTDTENKAALWMNKQFLSFVNILLELFHSSNTTATLNASFKCLLYFAGFQNDTQLFEKTIIILLFRNELSHGLKSIFSKCIFNPQTHSNINNKTANYAIKSFTQICHFSAKQSITKYFSLININRNDEASKLKLQSSFQWNALHILFFLSEKCCDDNHRAPPTKKAKLEESVSGTDINEGIIRKNRDNYLSIAWLNYLGSNQLQTKIYHLILTRLESAIFPVFKKSHTNGRYNNLILLSDFLTDSYNIGGEISLLSLKGLFILITKYNLDYPHFYEKLYCKLHANIFYSKNAHKFFGLLSLFLLKSDYIPQYLVVAFMKRLSRMSLFAPPNAIIFILNIITDLLRKYPTVRYMVDRSKKSNSGLMEALQVHKTQKVGRDNEMMEDGMVAVEGKGREAELLGMDHFDFECMDPKECGAEKSSLWELKTLIQHFEYKTSGYCFQTVTHFRDNNYQRISMDKCHMFEYHKLLNYYFITNEWFTKNATMQRGERKPGFVYGPGYNKYKIEEDRTKRYDKFGYDKYGNYNKDKNEAEAKKEYYNVHEISLERSDHLFPTDSLFGQLFSI